MEYGWASNSNDVWISSMDYAWGPVPEEASLNKMYVKKKINMMPFVRLGFLANYKLHPQS